MEDSRGKLENRIASAEGTEKVDLMNCLSAEMEGLKPGYALTTAQEAYKLAQCLGYEHGMGESLLHMCYACRRLSRYEESSAYIFSALEIFEHLDDIKNRIRALNLAGGNYFYFGRYDLSLEYFLKGLELAEQSDNPEQQASLLNNIGEIYRELEKYDQALEYYSQSLAISQKTGNQLHIAAAHINIGQIYRSLGKHNLALQFYQRGLELLQRIPAGKLFEGECLNEMGMVYESLDEREKALSHYLQSLNIFEEQGNRFYKIDAAVNLAGYYIKEGDNGKALDLLYKALRDARQISAASRVIRVCVLLADFFEKSGDFRNALQYFHEYHQLEKEKSSQEMEKKLNAATAQLKMEQARREAEIYRLKNEELKQTAEEIEKKARELEIANQKLEGLLSLDDLTDIPNRRTFKRMLELEWRRSLREQIPLSVIILDIDFFKRYNDRYGHPEGDECLKQVAKTLTASVKRSTDLVARYGGEEFIVLLPHTDVKGAGVVAELMRKSVEGLIIPHPDSKVAPVVTISLGAATVVPFDGMNPQELINRADKALYKAKQEGRNRVCVVEIEVPAEGCGV